MANTLDSFASDIASDILKDDDDNVAKFSFMAALAIVEIIIFLIKIFAKRINKGEDIKTIFRKLNIFQKIILGLKLRRYMKENSKNYQAYKEYQDVMLSKTLEKIESSEDEKIKNLILEVGV